MKKTPLFITIPMIAILIVVAAAVALKVLSPKPEVEVLKPTEFPNSVGTQTVTKHSTVMGGLFGKKASASPTATPTPGTAADLSKELKDTYDDGGQAELDAIAKDAEGL